METAGRAIADGLRRHYPNARRPLVVAGRGNNGGDGFVIARVLRDADDRLKPRVVVLGELPTSGEARENFELLVSMGMEVTIDPGEKELQVLLEGSDLIVDAVFGVGLSRPVEGDIARSFSQIDRTKCPVLAVDLPSGQSSDTGAVLGTRLRADLVVTLGLPKLGLALDPPNAEIWVADIGLPWDLIEGKAIRAHVWTDAVARRQLPDRIDDGHKGSFGHVFVVAGSEGKTGAACLAANAAIRGGAGLVTVAVPRSLNAIFEAKLTEPMTLPVEDDGRGYFVQGSLEQLIRGAEARDVVVLGPGIGQDPQTVRMLHDLLGRWQGPTVVDADGLNGFAGQPRALRANGARVLTPHPGEASRLLNVPVVEIQHDRVGHARRLAELADAVVVLKGKGTIVAAPDGQVLINPTGGPGLATAGTGDVLAGLIGALLGQGLEAFEAAGLSAYLHGLAGEHRNVGASASEVAERIPVVWDQVRRAQETSYAPGWLRRFYKPR